MATAVANPTLEDVQWLADHPRAEGLIVSCYADTSVSSAVRPLWHEHFKDEVKRIDEGLGGDPAAGAAFQQSVAAIDDVLTNHRPASARGMAVFADVRRGLTRGFALTVPVANRLVVDEEPYLVPLLEQLNRQRRYLVVHTDTHRSRLYTAVPGAVHLIEELNEDVPKRQRASGELWGKQQATIERHRENHVLHYFKELVREIERAWPEERYDGLVLLGEHEVLEALREHLPKHLATRVVGESPHAWAGHQASLGEKLEGIHAQAMRDHDRQILEDVRSHLLTRYQIATGPQAVIDALRNSQVGFPGHVVMEPDRGQAATRCAGCGSLFAQTPDTCPLCGARCERTNLWQAIALLASRHNIPVNVVEAGQGLEKEGGVVALLARAVPWAAPPASA